MACVQESPSNSDDTTCSLKGERILPRRRSVICALMKYPPRECLHHSVLCSEANNSPRICSTYAVSFLFLFTRSWFSCSICMMTYKAEGSIYLSGFYFTSFHSSLFTYFWLFLITCPLRRTKLIKMNHFC